MKSPTKNKFSIKLRLVMLAGVRKAPILLKLFPSVVQRWILIRCFNLSEEISKYHTIENRKFLDELMAEIGGKYRSVLFVGASPYTFKYTHKLRGRVLANDTIDVNERMRIWGGFRHFVAPVDQIGCFAAPEAYDCVVFNGVFGFGVNSPAALDDALAAIYAVMKNWRSFGFWME